MTDARGPLSDIAEAFDTARNLAAHEKALQEVFDLRQTEMKISDGKLAPENTARITNQSRMGNYADTEAKRKERRSHDHHMLMTSLEQLLEDLQALEAELVLKYGEDFAENLAAELLDETTYAEIMLITDQEERRHQIAIKINQGIQSGSIDPAQANINQDLVQWLSLSDSIKQQRSLIAAQNSTVEDSFQSEIDSKLLSDDNSAQEHNSETSVILANGTNEATIFDQLLPK